MVIYHTVVPNYIWSSSKENYAPETMSSTDRRMDRQMDGPTDGQGESSIHPLQLRWAGV